MTGTVSVAILTGGQSSRMGQNKALVEVGGKPILARIIERVQGLSNDLLLIANASAEYAPFRLPIYPDRIPGKGPLGGLYTALSHTRGAYTLVLSCDQPFVNPTLLEYLLSLRHGYDVVVPLASDGYPQSMHAVYSPACLEPIRRRLEADQLKVISFFKDVRVREVSGAEIDRFDPQRYSFMNVNTPDDLEAARRLAAQIG